MRLVSTGHFVDLQFHLVEPGRDEPTTSCLQSTRSPQLSYGLPPEDECFHVDYLDAMRSIKVVRLGRLELSDLTLIKRAL